MTSETQNIVEQLQGLIDVGRVSLEAISLMTGIEIESLQAFVDSDGSRAQVELVQAETPLLPGDAGRLATLIAQLTEGLQIDDDERVQGILETLVAACGLTSSNAAKLLQVDEGLLDRALIDIGSVPVETRYALGVRGSYLIGAVNQARR